MASNDRRRQPRAEQYYDCTWSGDWGEEHGRVNSLSVAGCYIESRSAVPENGTQLTAITVMLPAGAITLQGTVIHAIRGVGFAVQFTDVDEHAQNALSALVRQ